MAPPEFQPPEPMQGVSAATAATVPLLSTAQTSMATKKQTDTSERLAFSGISSTAAGGSAQQASDSLTPTTTPAFGTGQSHGSLGSNTTMSLHSPAPTAGAMQSAWTPSSAFSKVLNSTRRRRLSLSPESDPDSDLPMTRTDEGEEFTPKPSVDIVRPIKSHWRWRGPFSSHPPPPKLDSLSVLSGGTTMSESPVVHIFRQIANLGDGDHVVKAAQHQQAAELGNSAMSSELIHELRRTFTSAVEMARVTEFMSYENAERFRNAKIDITPTVSQAPAVVKVKASRGPSSFPKFMALPQEIRTQIYEMALHTGQAIQPHLCSRKPNGAIKFHDAAQHSRQDSNHDAINKLLGVTLVSKQVRAESLPCFYSINTFSVEADTATYFAHLEQLDRFHMIRQVRFGIPLIREKWTAHILEQMTTYIKDVEDFERSHSPITPYVLTLNSSNFGMVFDARVYNNLVEHPRHIASGLNTMAQFICLGMLSSAFTSTDNTNYTSSIVLPVPSGETFTAYPCLKWLSHVSHGLGMKLNFLDGHNLAYNHQAVVGVTWHQKFQKKDFKQKYKKEEAGDVAKRVEDMFPDTEAADRKFWNRCSYMRTSCDGHEYTWFTVKH